MKTKLCNSCQKTKPIKAFYYLRHRKQYAKTCRACNNKASTAYQTKSGYRKTENYVFYQRAYELRRRKHKCIDNLKELQAYLNQLWIDQKQCCYYTGIPMELTGYHTTPFAMSVDRVDATKGYVKGNIVLCLSIINKIKQNLTVKELKDWVSKIIVD